MNEHVERVQALLDQEGLDGLIITDPVNRLYLSGYSAEDHAPSSPQGVLLIGRNIAILLASPNNVDWAAAEAPGFTVRPWGRPWHATVAEQVAQCGWQRIGFEDGSTTVSVYQALQAGLGSRATLVPLGDAVERLRTIKTASDLAAIERALQLTEVGFAHGMRVLRPGISERALAWEIERAMREAGADGVAFPVTVAAGPHAARPHHRVTDREITAGEPVVIDAGARSAGFCGDLTRTVWLGEPDTRLRTVYNVVLEAQAAALSILRAGLPAKDADHAARSVIEAAGFGPAFVHGLGHGLGMRVHEAPSLSAASSDILQVGMVSTVEPGVYLPGWGGVRIEDVVLIEEDGCRILTRAPKFEFIEA